MFGFVLQPRPMNLLKIPILLQAAEFIAVDKPVGISVHNNEDSQNLLTLLEYQLSLPKLYPAHRLDKETSGIQVLATNEAGAKTLGEEFQNKLVKKIYVGILRGELKEQSGVWNKALTDKAEGHKNPAGQSADRVPCETRFKVVKASRYFTLCEFQLITGRQHQIRKHAAMANRPLVGDPRYGEKAYNNKMAHMYHSDRMFLHSYRLEVLGHLIESPIPENFGKLFT